MLELGEFSDQEHQEILKLALAINPDIIFLVGTEFGKALLKIAQGNPYVELFENSEALRERLEKREMTGITFLVKGSRGTRLERAIPALL
jgi:UDP-N-acetylmuramoyl-tripeptide--D-alanyl-D-alanine ligase